MIDFQFITPSEVMEYLFCPRFVYFMNVLKIEQHEHRRTLVNKGRDIHKLKMVQNKDYLRKKAGAVDKLTDVYLSSDKLKLVGKIDEVLFLEDGSAAPLDYKYAFWENKIYKTLKYQQVLYALLIMENFQVPVNKAYIIYTRSQNHLEELAVTPKMLDKAKLTLDEIFKIINMEIYPKPAKAKRKCSDCTYRNLCAT
ncbi:MAG TPA: CRISPR-associated protein Cas4 [Candidatus Cloacimonas sp.]|nr:CRISPR-associated protein Cas4 [Candidatus Cloacimonas sp.]HPS60992.1 CRISPR-associated protein Cas4 [Candidatus Cloacimonas sp.]